MDQDAKGLKTRLPPVSSLKNLTDAAISCGKKFRKSHRSILYPSRTHSIFFVLNGTVDILQQNPYRTLGVIVATIPIGLVELYYPDIDLGYKLNSNSDVLEIKHDDWDAYLSDSNLQNDVINALIYINFGLFIQIQEIYTQENIDTINNLIHRVSRLNEISPVDIPLSQFILERTNLSRSLVMKAISDLRSTGYIELKNGRLIKIIKTL